MSDNTEAKTELPNKVETGIPAENPGNDNSTSSSENSRNTGANPDAPAGTTETASNAGDNGEQGNGPVSAEAGAATNAAANTSETAGDADKGNGATSASPISAGDAGLTDSDKSEELTWERLQANAKQLVGDAQKLGVNVVALIKETAGVA